MIRLYRNATYPGHWVAYVSGSGWMIFPAKPHGWEERRPVRGLDPLHMRAVSPSLATGTGLLESLEEEHMLEVA
jgi:hypothetical protein